jgi:hypothetical protein
MHFKGWMVFALAFALSGCATAPAMTWIRTDGQQAALNPALQQQFVVDKTVCMGERQKADLSGTTFANGTLAAALAASERSHSADAVLQGCMASRGYLLVEADKAPEMAAQFTVARQVASPPNSGKSGPTARPTAVPATSLVQQPASAPATPPIGTALSTEIE